MQEGGRLTLPDYTLAGRDDAEGEAVYEASSPDLFDMTPVIGPSARILRIALDDMAPFVEPGGFITYDTKARPRRNQGVVLKTREGRMIIRRYQRTTPSHILTYKYVPFQHEGDLCYREVAEDIPLQDIVGVYPIGIRAD